MRFSYLGELDEVPANGLFRPAQEDGGPAESLVGTRPYRLDITGSLVEGRLQFDWSYSTNLHEPATVQRLAEEHVAALQALIAHCRAPGAGGYSPSDFPLAGLTQAQVAALAPALGAGIEDLYPLSPMQQGMLFHTQYSPGAGTYGVQLGWTVRGPLDLAAFQRAWEQAVARHPILRTAFVWEGLDAPLQLVYRQVALPWEALDWQGQTPAAQAARLEAWLRADRARDFALDTAPAMRLAVIQTAPDSCTVVWTHHHLLLDGWSWPLVMQEVWADYAAFQQGEDRDIRPVPPYRDYIAWLQRQDTAAAERFWRATLAGFTGATPLGIAPPATPEPGDQVAAIQIPAATVTELQAFARQHRLTLNTLVQGAWALLLSRYSEQADVVFGATVAGRPGDLPESDRMVGLFINTLPVRVAVPAGSAALDWLRGLQDSQAQARQYDYSPLVEVQRWSAVPHGRPLFESLFIFESYPVDPDAPPAPAGLDIQRSHSAEGTNYPLTLVAVPGAGGLRLQAEYDGQRFDAAAIWRLLGHWQTVLEGWPRAAAGRLADVPMLTEAERRQLLGDWNATEVAGPPEQPIQALFEGWAARTPDAAAVCVGDETWTYDALDVEANRLARYLRAQGVGPEVRVGLCVNRSPQLLVGILGILKAGGAYVPLDPTYPTERLAYMLADSGVRVLVTEEAVGPLLPPTAARLVYLDRDWPEIERKALTRADGGARPGNAAYVIYTSGSTGRPKGVVVTHATLWHSTQARLHYYPEPVRRFLLLSSFAFDSSVAGIFWTLSQGGTLALPPEGIERDPAELAGVIGEERVSHLLTIPSFYSLLLDHAPQLGPLRAVIVAGESCPVELPERHRRLLRETALYNEYGPTEGTVWSTVYEARERRAPVPIGRPIANVQVYLLDAYGQPVPVGVPGEVYIGGAGVARGYLNRPDLTAARFVPDPFGGVPGSRLYRTGDRARYGADGQIEFLGRMDTQVKLRGYRIELGEIEAVIGGLPGVREAVVLARPTSPLSLGEGSGEGSGSARLVAYLLAQPGAAPAPAELRRLVRQTLPDYMVPSAFVPLAAWPLTPNGKVDRQALPAPDGDAGARDTAYVAPATPAEIALARIWSEVLRQERVGAHDNFFDLGGHSLLATQVVARVQATLGVSLPLRSLFETPTVAALAAQIAQAPASAPGAATEAAIPRLAREPEAAALPDLDSLSDEEVAALLGELLDDEDRIA